MTTSDRQRAQQDEMDARMANGARLLCRLFSVCFLVGCALLLFGCASAPYWTRANEPVSYGVHVVHTDFPCSSRDPRQHGCWNPAGQTIEIRKGLSREDEDCAMRHEYAHSQGWTHPLNMAFVYDCGPGKI